MNNRIRAREVRLIDDTGKQIGIVPTEKALQMALDRHLDLIQVTQKVEPPVCKILDSGKYLYSLQKKEKKQKVKQKNELKIIRLRYNISDHDMETKAKQVKKFLERGDKIKINLRLRGREKAMGNIAKEKMEKFLEMVTKYIPLKIEQPINRKGGLLSATASKK